MSELVYSLRMHYRKYVDNMQRGETIGTEVRIFCKSQAVVFASSYRCREKKNQKYIPSIFIYVITIAHRLLIIIFTFGLSNRFLFNFFTQYGVYALSGILFSIAYFKIRPVNICAVNYAQNQLNKCYLL